MFVLIFNDRKLLVSLGNLILDIPLGATGNIQCRSLRVTNRHILLGEYNTQCCYDY